MEAIVRKTRSRKTKKNNVTIILELESKESAKELERNIKKAVHKWNRLLKKELSFKIVIIQPHSYKQQEVLQNQSDQKQ